MKVHRTKGKRVRDFFAIEANAIYLQYKSIESLLPHPNKSGSIHAPEEGRFVESLVRSFLNKHLPRNLRAFSGFIIKPATKTGLDSLDRVELEDDKHSSQIDIIVYDVAQFPVYEQHEEFCIVPPEGVIAIISVKKTLRIADVGKELKALFRTAEFCNLANTRPPHIAIFGFTSDLTDSPNASKKLFAKLANEYKGKLFDLMINELIVLDLMMLFKFRKESSDIANKAKYVSIDLKNNGHIALQRILQSILGVYYEKSVNAKIERPGYASFEKGTFGKAPLAGYIDLA